MALDDVEHECEHVAGTARDAKGKVAGRVVMLTRDGNGRLHAQAPKDVLVEENDNGSVTIWWPLDEEGSDVLLGVSQLDGA
jgi:hypothetical protein